MGIRSPIGQNLSLALGSSEVTLLELVTAYCVFANRGIRNDPLFVLKVEDKNGTVLERSSPRPVEVLSEETASVMTSMLQSVVDHGTGYPARALGFLNPAAGKTGTMDEYQDAWFVGFTPSLTCGVWVGYDEKRPIGPGMTGARAALPAWTDFMIGATRGRPVEDFPLPVGSTTREVCAETGMLATARRIPVLRSRRPSPARRRRQSIPSVSTSTTPSGDTETTPRPRPTITRVRRASRSAPGSTPVVRSARPRA
jgi:penicillin-binding protein 1A